MGVGVGVHFVCWSGPSPQVRGLLMLLLPDCTGRSKRFWRDAQLDGADGVEHSWEQSNNEEIKVS